MTETKYMVASDLHGSLLAGQKILDCFEKEQADKLILLGDIYYHGPRNPLPEGYNPRELFALLNRNKEKLIVIKGNCDSEVDQMVSEFDFQNELRLTLCGKNYLFTHGHIYNDGNIPADIDVIVYGHFHIDSIKKAGDKWVANPGSPALPKEASHAAYLLLDGKSIALKSLDGTLLQKEGLL